MFRAILIYQKGLLASVWARAKASIVTRDNTKEQHAHVLLSHDSNHASIALEALILSPESADGTEEVVLITENDESLRKKLSAHATTISPTLQTTIPNPRIHSTLALASSLAPTDPLLDQALHLWTLTHLLLPSAPSWTIDIQPLPHSPTPLATSSSPSSHHITDHHTIHLLTLHFRTTLESLAATHAQTLLLTLERRLERRSQCQNVATLLVGVLLLHCVEGMSHLFTSSTSFTSDNTQQPWPLAQPPEYYVAQADRFADFVVRLFRMRGVGVGAGVVVEEGTGRVGVGEGEGGGGVGEWVERLGLRVGEGGGMEGVRGEGRFWGGLLLPDG